jgi:hypothetical protein
MARRYGFERQLDCDAAFVKTDVLVPARKGKSGAVRE